MMTMYLWRYTGYGRKLFSYNTGLSRYFKCRLGSNDRFKGADGGTSPSDNGFKLFVPPNRILKAHISSSPSNDAMCIQTLDVDTWYFITVVINREEVFKNFT